MVMAMEEIERREEELKARLDSLSDGERTAFYRRFEKEFKDPDTYATLAYLFISGLHHFYLRRWGRGLLDVGLNLLGLLLVGLAMALESGWPAVLGVALWAGVALWELSYLFRSQAIVKEHNLRTQLAILDEMGWKA